MNHNYKDVHVYLQVYSRFTGVAKVNKKTTDKLFEAEDRLWDKGLKAALLGDKVVFVLEKLSKYDKFLGQMQETICFNPVHMNALEMTQNRIVAVERCI